MGTPEELYGKGTGDHAPIILCFGKPCVTKTVNNCIPKVICRNDKFRMHLDSLVSDCGLLQQPNHKILDVYKSCVQEASRLTRRDILFDDEISCAAKRMMLASISRAIWMNNFGLANKLLRSTALAHTHLEIRNGKVQCKDWEAFDAEFNASHSVNIQQQTEEHRHLRNTTEKACVKKQLKSRIQKYQRLQHVHWPKGKRLC